MLRTRTTAVCVLLICVFVCVAVFSVVLFWLHFCVICRFIAHVSASLLACVVLFLNCLLLTLCVPIVILPVGDAVGVLLALGVPIVMCQCAANSGCTHCDDVLLALGVPTGLLSC